MINNIVSWLGLQYANLSELEQLFVTVLFGIFILSFVFDILRYLLYIISRR